MDDRKPAAKKQPDRRKRKATATASSSSEAADLLPWIQRAQLENLITSSINNSSAITVHDLINAMPEAERWRVNEKTGRKKSSYTPVKGGAERINTGSFDIVDSTTMLNILMFLNCKERHTCVTSVCKGWREFKTSMPTLFLDLSDTHGWSVKGRAMQASQLLELMDWVPNLSAVTALRISTQDKCNPNTCKQIVKKLVAAKKKAKNAPMITKLVLQGPKIYGTLLTELKKSEIGNTLTYLRFEGVKITAQTKLANSLPDLLRSLPRLEELYLPQSLAVDGSLHTTVLGPLSAARSGSKSTLLRVLDLTTENHVYSHNRLSLHDLSRIGNSCPELEVLRLVAVAGSPIYRSSFLSGINPELIVASPIAPTPRLKEFEVRQLTDTFVYGHAPRYGSTEDVNRILSWLLAGMPAVEKFSFGHGKASMTRKHEKLYSYPSLPGIVHDDGQVMWPHTLKHLSLSCFSLGTETFTANTELPSLETLQLAECGGNVDTIINSLRSTHPNVEATKIEKSSRW